MQRILEPELMDDERQAVAYARADFSASNQLFVDRLVRDFPTHLRKVIDIGCGPGDVVMRLARAARKVQITAVDGSAPMIALARDAVGLARLEDRITLLQGRLPGLPLEPHSFDAVLSKDLLHHLPDPCAVWSEVTRLARPGGVIYVMDLIRPDTPEAAQRIVNTVAADEDPILRRDFYNSLCAAFTVDEVRTQLAEAQLNLHIEPVGERHMLINGPNPAGYDAGSS